MRSRYFAVRRRLMAVTTTAWLVRRARPLGPLLFPAGLGRAARGTRGARRGVIQRFLPEPLDESTAAGPTTPRVGEITVRNTQHAVNIDEARLRRCASALLRGARCGEFDLGVWLAPDVAVRKINAEHRGVNASTDILSFPFHDEAVPGEIPDAVPRDDDDLLNLGDLIVSVPYVARACARDRRAFEATGEPPVTEDDKGVARAMASVFDVQRRVHMLLVHGICHLMGYDHETDDDFDAMAKLEDHLLTHLQAFEEADAEALRRSDPGEEAHTAEPPQ